MRIITNGALDWQPDSLVIELAPTELYWEEINRRHFEICHAGASHLLLSLRVYETGEEKPIEADVRRYQHLTKCLNNELLVKMSIRFGEEILQLRRQIGVAQFDLYTLQGLLEDYLHEISFPGLKEALLALGKPGENFASEKERLKLWNELQQRLLFQKDILGHLLKATDSLSPSHSISSLRNIANALFLLIDASLSVRENILEWQKLWAHFGYQPLLISSKGSQREHFFHSALLSK